MESSNVYLSFKLLLLFKALYSVPIPVYVFVRVYKCVSVCVCVCVREVEIKSIISINMFYERVFGWNQWLEFLILAFQVYNKGSRHPEAMTSTHSFI